MRSIQAAADSHLPINLARRLLIKVNACILHYPVGILSGFISPADDPCIRP
jgi:hypothetical protein